MTFVALAFIGLLASIGEWQLVRSTRGRIYSTLHALPTNRAALVLGTNPRARSGEQNRYFSYRIRAAAALYHAGKVQHLLLSGDNGRSGYNEPMAMRSALVDEGVDASAMTLDFAGFTTFESIIRARDVFGLDRFTIVSQHFHNERAVWVARSLGIDAIAFDASDVQQTSTRLWLRERGARALMWCDYVFGREPTFRGERVTLGHQVLP